MSGRPATLTQADLVRIIRAAKKENTRVVVRIDGKPLGPVIEIEVNGAEPPVDQPSPYRL